LGPHVFYAVNLGNPSSSLSCSSAAYVDGFHSTFRCDYTFILLIFDEILVASTCQRFLKKLGDIEFFHAREVHRTSRHPCGRDNINNSKLCISFLAYTKEIPIKLIKRRINFFKYHGSPLDGTFYECNTRSKLLPFIIRSMVTPQSLELKV
jgi:hypothetical protein